MTIIIFTIGILLNYGLDFLRIATIESVISEHDLSTQAYLIEKEFAESVGSDTCDIMNARIAKLKAEIRQVGGDLSSYSRFSFFKKQDFDYLKRKYFLLEIRFLTLINAVNNECGHPYVPILFFYEIDDDLSERQGFILEEFSKEWEQQVVVLPIDKDYADEPLVKVLVDHYSITTAPTLIIDGEKIEGMYYQGQLAARVREMLLRADPYGEKQDFTYVVKAAGIAKELIIEDLDASLKQELQPFARADILLVKGRLTQDTELICEALQQYDQVESTDPEVMALVYESKAAVDCGSNTRAALRAAAEHWKQLGNTQRAEILEAIASGKKPKLSFETSELISKPRAVDAQTITLGATKLVLNSSAHVLTQVDRVYRDWLGGQLSQTPFEGALLNVFSERGKFNATELLPEIGWHEGGRTKFLSQIGITYGTAVGTMVAKQNGSWYAPNDHGVFMFEVPLDKVLYPTTRFLQDDIAVIVDTHGMNMLVEQALRKQPDAVLSDCDHPGKVKAAQYVSDRGIPVICFPDRFGYHALGHELQLITSPPMRIEDGVAIVGDQPVDVSVTEPIIVTNATLQPYALWYYTTPTDYFNSLDAFIAVNRTTVTVDDFRQMQKVVDAAKAIDAQVIAARVVDIQDYKVFKPWIEEDEKHRLILFHSASYPYGFKLLTEYPRQVTFGDVNPVFS